MTEGFIVFAIALAGLLLIDPFYGGGLSRAPVIKGMFVLVGTLTLALHLAGRAITAPARMHAATSEAIAAWWPAMLLAIYILAGSLYARLEARIEETFLAMGLGLLFLPLLALAVRSSDQPLLFAKALAAWYVLIAVGALGMLVSSAIASDTSLLHEEVFVVVPLGAYLICGRRFSAWRVLLGLAWIGACLASFKNTTFLLVLITLLACVVVWLGRFRRGRNSLAVSLAVLIVLPLAVAGVSALVYVWWEYRSMLPSGNIDYRAEMYGIAWRRFLESPIWGTGFTDSSVTHFDLFRVAISTQYLPTHSDILDLMVHGGLIAMALWTLIVWRIGAIALDAWRELVQADAKVDLRPWQWLYVLALIQIGALITYAFNPILIKPVQAFWIWGSAGLMWALHRELRAAIAPTAITPLVPRRGVPV